MKSGYPDSRSPIRENTPATGTRVDMRSVLLYALQEMLGSAELRSLLEPYSPEGDNRSLEVEVTVELIGRLPELLEHRYGVRSGRGIALRVGRACFRHGLRRYGPETGLDQISFRLQPLSVRLRSGLVAFACLFNDGVAEHVKIDEEADGWIWRIMDCPLCAAAVSDQPGCYLVVGALQEALSWMSGGRLYPVEEQLCLARGDSSCSFLISKTPLPQ